MRKMFPFDDVIMASYFIDQSPASGIYAHNDKIH